MMRENNPTGEAEGPETAGTELALSDTLPTREKNGRPVIDIPPCAVESKIELATIPPVTETRLRLNAGLAEGAQGFAEVMRFIRPIANIVPCVGPVCATTASTAVFVARGFQMDAPSGTLAHILVVQFGAFLTGMVPVLGALLATHESYMRTDADGVCANDLRKVEQDFKARLSAVGRGPAVEAVMGELREEKAQGREDAQEARRAVAVEAIQAGVKGAVGAERAVNFVGSVARNVKDYMHRQEASNSRRRIGKKDDCQS
ncbi:MAG: DUF4112 domain-containing protein [Candidatus Gracilibacteria bacterium]